MCEPKELTVRGELKTVSGCLNNCVVLELALPKNKDKLLIQLLNIYDAHKFRQSLKVVKINEKGGGISQPREFTTHYRATKTGEKISLNRLLHLISKYPTIKNWYEYPLPVSVKIKYAEDKKAKSFLIKDVIVYFYTRYNRQGDKFVIYTNLCSNCVYFKAFDLWINGEKKESENFFGLARTIIKLLKPNLN